MHMYLYIIVTLYGRPTAPCFIVCYKLDYAQHCSHIIDICSQIRSTCKWKNFETIYDQRHGGKLDGAFVEIFYYWESNIL